MPKATFTRAEIRKILGEAHTEEIENQLMALHLGVVDPLKDALQQAQNDANAAKNSGEYAKLKKEFDDYKADIASKEARAKKAEALKEIAKDAGLSEAGIAKAVKYADYDKIELDEKGAVKDKSNILKGLKDEWPEYIQTKAAKGAETATPPASDGSGPARTKAEILKIKDTTERQQAWGEYLKAQNNA